MPLAFAPALAAALLVLSLGGCATTTTSTDFKAHDPQSRTCLARCEITRTHCEQRQQLRERECQTHIEMVGEDYETCVANRGIGCLKPDTCLGADLRICRIQYGECVAVCEARYRPGAVQPADDDAPQTRATTAAED
ncbi:hypothetical protein [Marichromatium bheemlicum]|uniref:Lipoprotein n=1 Tax=Marichromatium bheemlicum TaxID=365339 RepID=A0ABX1I900_9GAMM|nr:hypothetical protein [Marichromatium bheemlicum]NKN33424.1 hypothetical protein [Marichromatium bheemlicum]